MPAVPGRDLVISALKGWRRADWRGRNTHETIRLSSRPPLLDHDSIIAAYAGLAFALEMEKQMLAFIRKLSLCFLIPLCPLSVHATEMTTTIDMIEVWDGLQDDGSIAGPGLVYVFPHGQMPTSPALPGGCGTTYYSFSLSRPNAKEYLATLLLAKASGSTVFLRGLGFCRDQSTSETLVYFRVN